MSFKPIRYDSGSLDTALTASSTTITKYDALSFASGYVQRATSSTTQVHAVAMESITTAGGAHTAIQILWTIGVEFLADCTNNSAQVDVGNTHDLTDHVKLANGTSSNDVFLVKDVVGAAADKLERGYFVPKITATT